jgi:hypothetical protein
MAKGWTKNRRCPICGLAGWGNQKCRGFEHSEGGAVFCEHPDELYDQAWEQTDIVISPFGIPLTCFRRVIS